MTTVGEIIDQGGRDVFGEAARYLSRTDAGLTRGQVTVSGPDFGGLREISVTDVLSDGWRDYGRLVAAAAATRDHPGSVGNVDLQELTLNFRYDPALVVYVDGVLLLRVPVSMDLVVTLAEFGAVVFRGCLTGITVRAMSVHVEVTAAHKVFATRPVGLLPEREIRLGRGIPLVAGASC
ncbi:MAG TPA: hypothetical protein VFC19_01935 [Candidatus Limnocylindrales bacterium]|nr:hypothetical protein [Candidatus Limnocylindrales bacterium]